MCGEPSLIPVYIGVYRRKDTYYRVLVNGTTGKLIGEAPLDWVKIGLIISTIVGIILIAVNLGQEFPFFRRFLERFLPFFTVLSETAVVLLLSTIASQFFSFLLPRCPFHLHSIDRVVSGARFVQRHRLYQRYQVVWFFSD